MCQFVSNLFLENCTIQNNDFFTLLLALQAGGRRFEPGWLLTTVGDLFRFPHNLGTGELGGPRFVEEMHRQGVLNSGTTISYPSGLFVGEYKGVREVQHSGATEAYRGYLTRFPDQWIAVVVMCNASNANVGGIAHDVADLFLGGAITEPQAPVAPLTIQVSSEHLASLAGGYRITQGTRRGTLFTVVAGKDRLLAAGTQLFPVAENRFESAGGTVLQFDGPATGEGRPEATLNPGHEEVRMLPVAPFEPTETELAEYAGTYRSDEAEATYTMVVEDGKLRRRRKFRDPVALVHGSGPDRRLRDPQPRPGVHLDAVI